MLQTENQIKHKSEWQKTLKREKEEPQTQFQFWSSNTDFRTQRQNTQILMHIFEEATNIYVSSAFATSELI